MKKPEESDAVFEVKHRHGNSVASFQCAHVIKLIIYITKSTHLQVIPQQNIQNFAISDMQEKLVDFFIVHTVVDFSSRNNFAN